MEGDQSFDEEEDEEEEEDVPVSKKRPANSPVGKNQVRCCYHGDQRLPWFDPLSS